MIIYRVNIGFCLTSFKKLKQIGEHGDFDKIDDIFSEIENSEEFANNNIFKMIIFKEKASISAKQGKMDDCSKLVDQGFEILKNIELSENFNNDIFQEKFDECESTFYSLQGRMEYYTGNIDIAMEKFQTALNLRNKFPKRSNIASSLNQIGIVHYRKGELKEAEKHFQKSIEIFLEVENKREIAYTYNNLGNVYADEGNMEMALEQYKSSLSFLEKVGFPLDISAALENIVILMVEHNLDGVSEYLNKLEKIFTDEPENTHLELSYKYTRAVFLKSSKRAKYKIEAQGLFEYIITELDIDSEITISSIKNNVDLLLTEYKNYGEPEVLDEISESLTKLHTIGEEQRSSRVIIQSLILQAQFVMLESRDIQRARQVLNQAEIMANEKNLVSLAVMVSTTYDNLLEQDELPASKHLSDIRTTVNLLSNDDIKQEIEDETPLIFLIIERNKICIYSKSFQSSMNNEKATLIANYLLALDLINQEAFSTSGVLERIKYEGHTIIIKNNHNQMYCYAFKGASYPATKKLDLIIVEFFNENILKQLQNSPHLSKALINKIANIIDKIILEKYLKEYQF